jgi:hypothetical protein
MRPLIRDVLFCIALAASAVLAWPISPWTNVVQYDIAITATGNKSPQSQGSEVWINAAPTEVNLDALVATSEPAGGWERRGAVLTSYKNQPATISYSGPLSANAVFVFGRHGWSGELKLEINGEMKTLDLFAAGTAEPEVVKISEFSARTTLHWNNWDKFLGLVMLWSFLIGGMLYLWRSRLKDMSLAMIGTATSSPPNYTSWPKIYAVLTLTGILINWPGRAVPDTIGMLHMARNVTTTDDWHSPFVAFVYILLDPLFGSPGGALVIQVALTMLWPALVMAGILNAGAKVPKLSRIAAVLSWCIVCMMLIALTGTIVKDVLTVALLSALLFAIFRHRQASLANSLWLRWNVVLPVIALALVRPPNSVVVAVTALSTIFISPRQMWAGIILRSAAIGASLLLLSLVTFNYLLPAKHTPIALAVPAFDLAGIAYFSKDDSFSELGPFKRRLWNCYDGRKVDSLIWGDCKDYWPLMISNEAQVRRLWVREILDHPLAYARHRVTYATNLLRPSDGRSRIVVPPPPEFTLATNSPALIASMAAEITQGIQLWRPTLAYAPFGMVAHGWFTSVLGYPALWLAILTAALISAARRPSVVAHPMLIIASAGLSYALLLVAVGPADDFRYLLPVMFTTIATAVIVLERFQLSRPM